MKKSLSFLCILLFSSLSLVCSSQVSPPGVSWKRSDRINFFPPQVQSITPTNLDISESSEDWWYDHKNSYAGGIVDPENFDGFITCGYSLIRNIAWTEGNDGCYVPDFPLDMTGHYCDEELCYAHFTSPGVLGQESF